MKLQEQHRDSSTGTVSKYPMYREGETDVRPSELGVANTLRCLLKKCEFNMPAPKGEMGSSVVRGLDEGSSSRLYSTCKSEVRLNMRQLFSRYLYIYIYIYLVFSFYSFYSFFFQLNS